MHTYLVLQDPGHNKVYYDQSQKMALAELTLTGAQFEEVCSDYQIITLSGIRYLSFNSLSSISERSLNLLSQLSFAFALFEQTETKNNTLLRPIQKSFVPCINPKISSVLKYPGKTNELFTRMMINIARLTGNQNWEHGQRLFDPISGRGTTLYEGMIYGFDVTGMELKPQPVKDAHVFLKKFFEKEKIKHKFDKYKIPGKNNEATIQKIEFAYALDKNAFRDPKLQKKVSLIEGNSSLANIYFKDHTFNYIVGDLPYGIAHNNANKTDSESRNPYSFLNDSLNSWFDVLKPGGAIVLAWNAFVINPDKMRELLIRKGFNVLSDSPYDQFVHMVDSSIKRDIVVATKSE